MAEIPITGVPSSFRVPGIFAEILFAQGPSTGGAAVRDIIAIAPKLAAGTWANNEVVQVRNSNEAQVGAGAGSFLHRMLRFMMSVNKDARYFALPYAPTADGAPVAATGTITIATNPTGTGTVTVTICGTTVYVAFNSTDTPTTIAEDLVSAINAQTHLPVVASNVAGVITLTAKTLGAYSGNGTEPTIRFRANITSGITTTVTTSGVALGLGTGTPGADGTTTELANLTTALTSIDSDRKYYIVTSLNTAAALAAVKLHVATKSEPKRGLRSRAIAGFNGAYAAAATLANGLNYERMQIHFQKNSELTPDELAAQLAAILHKYESQDPAVNLASYRGNDWLVPAAYSQLDWPNLDDQADAINDGLAIIASNQTGSYLVYNATTRSKDLLGVTDDPRVLEAHRVSTADDYCDQAIIFLDSQVRGKKLQSDQFLADGVTVNANQQIPPNTVTPSTVFPGLRNFIQDYAPGRLQDVDKTIESLIILRDPQNTSRFEISNEIRIVDHANQITYKLAEVSPG